MWLVWALAAAACIQLAPNPVYVALVIGIASVAVSLHAQPGPYAHAFPLLLAVGTLFAVVRMLLTVVTTHGVGDVLFTTPHFGLPQLLGGFTVGGTVELPVVLQSLAEGFAIVGVMARVRRVQLRGLAFRAGAVDAPCVLRGRAGGRGGAGVRAVHALGHRTTYARPTAPAPAAGSCAGDGSSASSCRCSSSGWSGR